MLEVDSALPACSQGDLGGIGYNRRLTIGRNHGQRRYFPGSHSDLTTILG